MSWLLLIATLPGQNSGLRVRFWRQMKALGAAILRDGVYLLPQRSELRQSLDELRGELSAAGATAYIVELAKQDAELEDEWLGLFDRAEAYRECKAELDALLKAFARVHGSGSTPSISALAQKPGSGLRDRLLPRRRSRTGTTRRGGRGGASHAPLQPR